MLGSLRTSPDPLELARIEGQIAITTLLRRFPRIALTGVPLVHFPNLAFRALKALPVLVSRA